MSRPRKPTASHRLDGTYRDDRHGLRADDLFTHGEPEKPAWLDDDASWAWDTVVSFIPEPVRCELDVLLLAGMCDWWSKWRRFAKQVTSADEDEYKAVMKAAIAWKQFDKCASRFGLSPVDRARLNVRLTEADDDEQDNAFLTEDE